MNRYTRKKSLRLQNYDYAKNGLYFITICTKNSQHMFGTVENGEMNLNSAGEMVKRIWFEISTYPKLISNPSNCPYRAKTSWI